ncbi:MAG: MarR family transcriptional regulator [Acutalibacteraceae bacterium]|nr:MarR family transcriptional regulator [Acutalibacteraceae bacterium]
MIEKYKNQVTLFGVICKINNQYYAIGEKFYNEISIKQEYLLSVMEYKFSEHPPTLNQLATYTGCSHQNVKQIVLKLVSKGYLRIEQDEKDRRKRLVYFTEKYYQNKSDFTRRREKFMENLFEGVTEEEICSTINIIKKISNNQKNML